MKNPPRRLDHKIRRFASRVRVIVYLIIYHVYIYGIYLPIERGPRLNRDRTVCEIMFEIQSFKTLLSVRNMEHDDSDDF